MAMLRQGPVNVDDLTDDVLLEIFLYLSLDEISTSVRNTSLRWKSLSEDTFLWSRYMYVPPPNTTEESLALTVIRNPQLRSFLFKQSVNMKNMVRIIKNYCRNIKALIFKGKRNYPEFESNKYSFFNPDVGRFEIYDCFEHVNHDSAKLFAVNHQKNRIVTSALTGEETVKQLILEKVYSTEIFYYKGCVTETVFEMICACRQLSYLCINTLTNSEVDVDLRLISQLTKLSTLQLMGLQTATSCMVDNDFLRFVCLHNLTKLEIVEGGIALEAGLNFILLACPNLSHLNVQRNFLLDDDMENIKFCRKLEYLDVSHNVKLTNHFLRFVAEGCSNLKMIDISFCPEVGDLGIIILKPCRQLEILIIEGSYFTGDFFYSIPDLFPNLWEFHARHFSKDAILYNLRMRMPLLRIFVECNPQLVVNCRYCARFIYNYSSSSSSNASSASSSSSTT